MKKVLAASLAAAVLAMSGVAAAPATVVAFEFVSDAGVYRIVNVIPLGQPDAPAAQGSRGGMHGAMMGDMARMPEMCESMMGGKQR